MIHLKKAKEKDLNTIAKLAYVIWNNHYVEIIGKNQVDYMLEKIYNHDSLIEQLNIKKHDFYLIEDDSKAIGFLSISSENKTDFFIHKLYIDSYYSNKGIGTTVLNLVIKETNPKSLILTVNRQNFKSINFYFKNGFKINKVEDFDIGNGYQMNDFVMIKQIK